MNQSETTIILNAKRYTNLGDSDLVTKNNLEHIHNLSGKDGKFSLICFAFHVSRPNKFGGFIDKKFDCI